MRRTFGGIKTIIVLLRAFAYGFLEAYMDEGKKHGSEFKERGAI